MRSMLFFLVLTCAAFAGEPPAVGFLDVVQPRPVVPVPAAGEAVKLSGDTLDVFASDTPILFTSSPANLLAVAELAKGGEVKIAIKARFVADPTRSVLRNFSGRKFVYTIEPTGAGAGTVTLIAIPVGVTDLSQVVSRTYTVSGSGPVPGPDVEPKPVPVDEFATRLRSAYTGETSANKAAELAALAKLYSNAAAELDRTTFGTWGELYSFLQEDAKTLGVSGRLVGVQSVVSVELLKTLPGRGAGDKPLDATGKAAAKTAFTKVSKALGGVR